MMLVSIITAACDAQSTIGRMVASLLAQTHAHWEVIIVADDHYDYDMHLRREGVQDPRIKHASTGAVRSGTFNARNIGLSLAQGDAIATLDADDLFLPRRLEVLAPLAREYGVTTDNPAVVDDETGALLYQAFDSHDHTGNIGITALLDLTTPLFPVVRRDLAMSQLEGITHGDDVIANLRLIDRAGSMYAVPDSLMEYRIIPGSLCHAPSSAMMFDAAYGEMLARLKRGDGFGLLSVENRAAAVRGIARKRALNRDFAQAQLTAPELNFQQFAAQRRSTT